MKNFKKRISITIMIIVAVLFQCLVMLLILRPDLRLEPGEEIRIDNWTSLDQYIFVSEKIYKDLSYTLYRVDENGLEEVINIPIERFKSSSHKVDEEYVNTLIYVDSNDYMIVKNVSNKTIMLRLQLRP